MVTFNPNVLWLVPAILSVAFMLWVLWGFWQDERPKKQAGYRQITIERRPPSGSGFSHAAGAPTPHGSFGR